MIYSCFIPGKLKGLNNAERNTLVSNEWKNLSPSKKERLAEEATRINEIEIEEITENEKAILVKKHKRRLLDEVRSECLSFSKMLFCSF